ncbi:MAG TPA: TolC family protein [bacterium]|nr:TolC family protein [bacterium]
MSAPPTHSEEWSVPAWEKTTKIPDAAWASIRQQSYDTSKPLTPAQLIDIALTNNPDTQKVWYDTRAAAARYRQSQGAWSPQINAGSQLTRDQTGSTNEALNTSSLQFGPQLTASYLLLDLGGRAGTIEQTRQALIASNFQFNQALQDLIFNVANAYYSLYSAQANVEAAEADVRDTKTSFDAATAKLDAGLVTKLDVLQSQSSYQTALYNLDSAKLLVKTAHANLTRVLRWPADKQFEIVTPTLKIDEDISKEAVTRLIEEALKFRPDIAATRAAVRAKAAAVTVANSALWPSLNLGSSYSQNVAKNYYAESVERYGNGHNINGFVSVNWAIFDGLANVNRKRAAQADLQSAQEALVAAELEASADVWKKYYSYNTALSKLKDSEALLQTATESYALASEGYNAGLKSILDVLQAQSSLSSARSKLVLSRKDVFVTLADLARSIGWLTTKEAKTVVNARVQHEPAAADEPVPGVPDQTQ